MKRSPLPRSTKPLPRSAIKRKTRRGDDAELRREWAAEHLDCAACWSGWRAFGHATEVHHILGGRFGRPDARWNYLSLCRECHDRLQGGRRNVAICLRLKAESNVEDYDRDAMQQHMARMSRELLVETASQLPDWILTAREKR